MRRGIRYSALAALGLGDFKQRQRTKINALSTAYNIARLAGDGPMSNSKCVRTIVSVLQRGA
jgi:hypothetical protein